MRFNNGNRIWWVFNAALDSPPSSRGRRSPSKEKKRKEGRVFFLTSSGSPTLQPIGLFSLAQVMNKGAELGDIMDLLSDYHLFLDYVGLWQV